MSDEPRQLGQDRGETRFQYPSEHRAAVAAMAGQAQNSLRIFCHDLEPQIFDQPAFYEGVRRIAVAHDRSRIQVLIRDPKTVALRGSQLLDLSRRLASSIELRCPSRDFADRKDAFLLADDIGIVYRRIYSMFDGYADYCAPRQARELAQEFDEMWQTSSRSPEFLRLHL